MSSYVSPALRRLVAERAEHLCEYCLIHEDDTFLGCQVEHIISEKHGGATIESNLAYACIFCNRLKGSDIATLTRDGGLCRLFHPRTDSWFDHFRLNGAHVEATSDVGEATATLLGLNHVDRLLERQELGEIGRYPSGAALRRIRDTL
jgi:hypothetical protein